jgi:hypothetical protein
MSLKVGQTHLALASRALDAIEMWIANIGNNTDRLTMMCTRLLPILRDYLHSDDSRIGELNSCWQITISFCCRRSTKVIDCKFVAKKSNKIENKCRQSIGIGAEIERYSSTNNIHNWCNWWQSLFRFSDYGNVWMFFSATD